MSSAHGIRVLSPGLIGRIAAGEVVERPGSVVKELLENALDAGATRVRVEIEGEATGLLRVADDGAGIAAAEVAVAVERHATSKITEDPDLDHIATLGFRGEGLAAIGAVSRLTLISRHRDEELGAQVRVEGSEVGLAEPAARAVGTTVEVRDLFYNTPARLKYLKSRSAELRFISQLLQAYGLARPELHLSLAVDGRTTLELPGASDLHERVGQVFGPRRRDRMVPVLHEEPGLVLEGFVGAPEDSRARSGHQIFLINGRWVTSPLLRTAVREGYGDLIPPSRHPEAVLELRVPADAVDVNVHPTKREVRLRDERQLYGRLIRLVRDTVEERFPALRAPGPERPTGDPHENQVPLGLYLSRGEAAGRVADRGRDPEVIPFPAPPGDGSADVAETPGGTSASGSDEETGAPAMASMWQLHGTYILAAIADGLLVIDQHAAHERVLFEQALARLRGQPATSQELLFPITVELSYDEIQVLLETHNILERLGFHLELFGDTTVLVHAIPVGLREWRHGALLRDVLDSFADLPTRLDVEERVARAVACEGAVKANHRLSLAEMNSLVDQLFATEKPQGDPHGRPVFLRMPLDDLHRRFGRST